MAFDVLLVSAIGDSKKATVLARRLRALKFRVRYDAKRTHTTPSARDLSDCNKATSVLVLWSAKACNSDEADSDWVHAMAHLARSRSDALVQADLDETVPDEPFDTDERFDLAGLTARATPGGFKALCETLGERDGREGVADWLSLSSGDEAGKAEWMAAHPNDPLAQNGGRRQATIAPAPETVKPASQPTRKADERVTTAAAASAAATAQLAGASAGNRLELKPPKPEVDFASDRSGRASGLFMLVPTGLLLVGMMVMAFMFRTSPAELSGGGGTGIVNIVASCPAGQVPRSLVHSSLLPSDQDEGAVDAAQSPGEADGN
ncbi:hypothetical protein D1224_04140 [Henriciella barbarensis]|uniref:TIR domain-containing protein n=1 Tax=Henriciella barbarensis TaxID=86342 RepID=A0A399R120_9PROT|nr:hypothetical protein [Henriciella barbarensis]RIJ23462.1 hypothetical protein D1224_04140 [Henriciella barbarensis]